MKLADHRLGIGISLHTVDALSYEALGQLLDRVRIDGGLTLNRLTPHGLSMRNHTARHVQLELA